jgi:hypothetical protein
MITLHAISLPLLIFLRRFHADFLLHIIDIILRLITPLGRLFQPPLSPSALASCRRR